MLICIDDQQKYARCVTIEPKTYGELVVLHGYDEEEWQRENSRVWR